MSFGGSGRSFATDICSPVNKIKNLIVNPRFVLNYLGFPKLFCIVSAVSCRSLLALLDFLGLCVGRETGSFEAQMNHVKIVVVVGVFFFYVMFAASILAIPTRLVM